MDIDLRVDGNVRITGDLDTVLRHAGRPFMRAIRNSIDDEIQRTCPVDSGDLRDSCFVLLDAKSNLEVGATVRYAAAVEDGYTHYQSGRWIPGQHFLRAAVVKYTRGRL